MRGSKKKNPGSAPDVIYFYNKNIPHIPNNIFSWEIYVMSGAYICVCPGGGGLGVRALFLRILLWEYYKFEFSRGWFLLLYYIGYMGQDRSLYIALL